MHPLMERQLWENRKTPPKKLPLRDEYPEQPTQNWRGGASQRSAGPPDVMMAAGLIASHRRALTC